jgi:hypothetical protein
LRQIVARHYILLTCSSKPASQQAASSKQQAASFKLRRFVICSPDPNMIYCSSINKGERHERKNSKIRIPSGRSEARRGQEECRQVLTGTDPGDAAGTPRVPNYGPKIHRDRISGNSKSSRQRSSSRLCLELTQRALSGATPLTTNLPGLPSLRSDATTRETWCRAPSNKQQAARLKQQAASSSSSSNKLFKAQAPSCSRCKRQASSPKQQASSFKPQAASSRTWLPVYSLTSLSFECLGARDFIKIKEFLGCLIWKLIWWGERRTALLTVTFSSTVKNTLFLLYPNRSGVPKELEFSILVHKILGVNFFHSCQNFASGFRVTRSFSKPCPFAKIPG